MMVVNCTFLWSSSRPGTRWQTAGSLREGRKDATKPARFDPKPTKTRKESRSPNGFWYTSNGSHCFTFCPRSPLKYLRSLRSNNISLCEKRAHHRFHRTRRTLGVKQRASGALANQNLGSKVVRVSQTTPKHRVMKMAQHHEAGPRRGDTTVNSQHRRECHTEPNREEPVVVIIAPNKDASTTTTMHLGVVTYPRAAINHVLATVSEGWTPSTSIF